MILFSERYCRTIKLALQVSLPPSRNCMSKYTVLRQNQRSGYQSLHANVITGVYTIKAFEYAGGKCAALKLLSNLRKACQWVQNFGCPTMPCPSICIRAS